MYACIFSRKKASAAAPLLTRENYDAEYSFTTFDDFCKQQIEIVGSEDNYLPKVFQYTHYNKHADYRSGFYLKSMVSSVNDLFEELSEQMTKYLRGEVKSTEKYHGQRSEWSPEHITRLLNIEMDENQGVEGNLHLKAGPFHKFIPYSNHTISLLPEGNSVTSNSFIHTLHTYIHTYIINRYTYLLVNIDAYIL